MITDSPKEADFVIYKEQEKNDLPSGLLIEAKYTPGEEKLRLGEVRFQTFRNIVSAKSSGNKNIRTGSAVAIGKSSNYQTFATIQLGRPAGVGTVLIALNGYTPPMAGLQGIKAILSASKVTSAVAQPMRADANAASQPAWPPPITMTSYFFILFCIN